MAAVDHEYPRADRGPVREVVDPVARDEIADRGSEGETYQYQADIGHIDHSENFACRCAVNLAQSDLLAPEFRFEKDQAENSDERDEYRQQTEQRDLPAVAFSFR